MNGLLVVDARYGGPPGSANGGYAAGRIAAFLDGAVEVTLRRPIPLDTPLRVTTGDEGVEVTLGGNLLAEARPADIDLVPPPPPSFGEAERAARVAMAHNPFRVCFVCGLERADGLRIWPGRLDGVLAAPWTPRPDLAGDDGAVRPEFVWAALDCPSAWPVSDNRDVYDGVLGRIAARLDAPVEPGERCLIVAWALGVEGRKGHAGAALYVGDDVRALARTTWLWPAE